MANSIDLPMEIVVEIMLFLPAESLVRFKCVCRSWYSIINDRNFVAKHLHKANKNSSTKSLFFTGFSEGYQYPIRLCLTVCDDEDDSDRVRSVTEDSLAPLFQHHTDKYLLSSQCNGIFCLSVECNNNVMLCNPATRQFNFLPDSSFRVKIHGIMLGFGYDPSVDGYKVVRVVLLQSQDAFVLRAEAYTLGSGSWREIKMNLILSQLELLVLSIAYGRNVHKHRYCKGYCYWLLSPLPTEKETIICFDMREEQFSRISLPSEFVGEREGMHTSLEVWNESVALFHYPYRAEVTRPIEIWKMLDSSCGSKSASCWTKHISIDPLESICRPIIFWKVDELLMSTEDGHVISYNLHTKNSRNLPIPHGSIICNTSVYAKSLVSVHGKN